MKILKIRWQRLVSDEGKTCERCGATGEEVNKAYEKLQQTLVPLGINVVLEKVKLDKTETLEDSLQSNRIWIGNKLLEDWLSATEGKSDCSSCDTICGEKVDCRTVNIAGKAYETIPVHLIVKAGLLAAAEMLEAEPASCATSTGCESSSNANTNCTPGCAPSSCK